VSVVVTVAHARVAGKIGRMQNQYFTDVSPAIFLQLISQISTTNGSRKQPRALAVMDRVVVIVQPALMEAATGSLLLLSPLSVQGEISLSTQACD